MQTITHNAAHQAVQAKPCQNCRDNFPLPEPKDFFDQRVVTGYIERRTACSACPAAVKPCLPASPAADLAPVVQLVLQCQDDTESIRTVLRAYRGVETLIGHSDLSASPSGDELAELLRTFTMAIDARLVNLDNKLTAANTALREREQQGRIDAHAPHLAFEAVDQLGHLRFGRDAFAAMHSLVPYAEHAEAEDLSAALHILGESMAARLQIMDDQLDALHAALVLHEAQAAAAAAATSATPSAQVPS
ncbi:hypothetical protein AVMA1855_06690 [Acidovorax sp. SUPP1855]|uniref:hypothetical protein n=1 Tax=Acidovorax sp. SUPP1855 TaxID=431774 RepID=UPI0023DE540F|nr:hypothetical protein [Acidovorax sp. SUPP1855]GKS83812.1 hypothetical protein AVMA1855_06690 [Acidovorax sp. SUPP1855]